MTDVYQYLDTNKVTYKEHKHPPVFTCEESERLCRDIPGLACKNLVLVGKATGAYYLLVMPAAKRADLKKFAEVVSEKRVSFASAEVVREKLGLEPGSVSPFGLINDTNQEMNMFIDREVYDAPIVGFHPNINDATLELTQEMFHTYLQSLDHVTNVVDL